MSEQHETEWGGVLGARSRVQARRPDRFLLQHILPLLFRRSSSAKGARRVFEREQDFWKESGALALASVALSGFRITDWFPRAPGVYWSEYGVRTRAHIYRGPTQTDPELGPIFSPQSKMGLIEEGGIGTIRLRPRRIDETDYWLASAVTGTQCAGGVPLAVPDSLIQSGKIEWGSTVKISGQLRFLENIPDLAHTAASVHHAHSTLLFVEKIERLVKAKQIEGPLILTPVVLFSDADQGTKGMRGHTDDLQYTFVQVGAGADRELDEAGRWVDKYAGKHGGRVITNFDERRPLLADAPLSYQRLVQGTYERVIIENLHLQGTKLADRIDHVENVMTVNVTLGSGVVIKGDLIVANSIKDISMRTRPNRPRTILKR